MPNRDLEFLYEIGSLRYLQRGWRQHFGMDVANLFSVERNVLEIILEEL